MSCVVPVYNAERYIVDTIGSILAQTHGVLEIIVVDDGCTDGTRERLEDFAAAIVVIGQANAGTAAARNAGMRRARGEFVAFLDADDLWHPEKTARQLQRFRERPGLEVSFTWIQNFISPDTAGQGRPADEGMLRPVPGYVCPTMLMRREVIDRVGWFDASLNHANEPDWILRAAELGVCMEILPDVLVRRRLHPGSRSSRHAGSSHDEYLRLLKARLDRRRAGKLIDYDFSSRPREA